MPVWVLVEIDYCNGPNGKDNADDNVDVGGVGGILEQLNFIFSELEI